MKNLMKAAGRTEKFAKFIWQNNNQETISSGYESAVENLHADTKERLNFLQKEKNLSESKRKSFEKKVDKAASVAMKEIKKLIVDKNGNIDTYLVEENAAKIANLTKTNKLGGKDINNMFRTEVVARLNEYLENGAVSLEDASLTLIKSMENMSYSKKTPTSKKVLDATNAMRYGELTFRRGDGYAGYKALARNMDVLGQDNISFDINGVFELSGKEYQVKNFEVLIGAAMTKVNPNFLAKFRVENAIIKNGKLVATMANGCKGNFVLAEIQEVKDQPNPTIKYKVCWDGTLVPIDQPCPPKPGPENDCKDCDTFKTLVSADTSGEMYESNLLLDKNCPADIFEKNFAKMEELNIFEKMKITKKWTNNMTAREKWNTMSPDDQKWAITQYQHEIALEGVNRLERFYNEVFREHGLKDKLEKIQNGRLLEGGVLGWLEQIPKIFQNKDKAKARRIQRKLGLTVEEYDAMMKEGANNLAEVTNRGRYTIEEINAKLAKMSPKDRERAIEAAKKQAERFGALETFDRAMSKGSMFHAEKMLFPDVLVVAASFAVGMPDLPITNIKLPRWLGTQISLLPGMDAIAKTHYGNEINNSYTGFAQEVIDALNKEVQLGDNAATLTAEMMHNISLLHKLERTSQGNGAQINALRNKINIQNERLQVWEQNLQETIDRLLDANDERLDDILNESKSTERHNFKWSERIKDRYKEVHQARKKLRKILRKARNNKSVLVNPEVQESLESLQKNFLAEINNDFGADFEFDKFGKIINKNKEFTLNIKRKIARNISAKIKINTLDDGHKEFNIDYSSIKFGNKKWESLGKNAKDKVSVLINEYLQDMQKRLAEVQELHGLSTMVDQYTKAINVRKVRAEIYSAYQSDHQQDSVDNVEESSSFAILTRLENDYESRNALIHCNDCWFTNDVKLLMEKYFSIDDQENPDEKVKAFRELQKAGFQKQYNEMIKVMGEAIHGYSKYQVDGVKKYVFRLDNGIECTPSEVKEYLKRGERVYIYDNLTGEIQKRIPLTLNMFVEAYKKTVPNERFIPKNDQILAVNDNLGYQQTLEWIQSQSQWAGATGYEILTNEAGSVTGMKLLFGESVKKGVKLVSLGTLKKVLPLTIVSSLIGQKLENNRYGRSYEMRDVSDYNTVENTVENDNYTEFTDYSRENLSNKKVIDILQRGTTPQEALKIVEKAQWKSYNDKLTVIREIKKAPLNSNIKVFNISETPMRTLKGSDCLCKWIREHAGTPTTNDEKATATYNYKITKVPSLGAFSSRLSTITESPGFPHDANSVKQFLELNKEYVYPSSYTQAMALLNSVSPNTKVKVVNGSEILIPSMGWKFKLEIKGNKSSSNNQNPAKKMKQGTYNETGKQAEAMLLAAKEGIATFIDKNNKSYKVDVAKKDQLKFYLRKLKKGIFFLTKFEK